MFLKQMYREPSGGGVRKKKKKEIIIELKL